MTARKPPSSGKSAINVQARTGPTPGIDVSAATSSRCLAGYDAIGLKPTWEPKVQHPRRGGESASDALSPYSPPHSIRREFLDELARRFGGTPRGQVRKKWKTGEGKQHIDEGTDRLGVQLTVFGHPANENGQ